MIQIDTYFSHNTIHYKPISSRILGQCTWLSTTINKCSREYDGIARDIIYAGALVTHLTGRLIVLMIASLEFYPSVAIGLVGLAMLQVVPGNAFLQKHSLQSLTYAFHTVIGMDSVNFLPYNYHFENVLWQDLYGYIAHAMKVHKIVIPYLDSATPIKSHLLTDNIRDVITDLVHALKEDILSAPESERDGLQAFLVEIGKSKKPRIVEMLNDLIPSVLGDIIADYAAPGKI